MKKKNIATKIEFFSSFNSSNSADHIRWCNMSPKQRWDELAIIQKRVWGSRWTRGKIKRTASYEKLDWVK